jgi:RNA polymerase sigma-70 factor (ECF subfamily)
VREVTDAELLAAARTDPDALATVYRRHSEAIDKWFRARVSSADAAELTAETFAQAALSIRRFRDPGHGSAKPWLYGIASNLLRRYYELQRVETAARMRLGMPPRSFNDDLTNEIAEREHAVRLAAPLYESLRLLPARQREAVLLRVVHELPYSQIAQQLGCTEGAVRIRVMRGLSALARSLRSGSAA